MDLLSALFMVLQCQHIEDLLFVANLPGDSQEAHRGFSAMLGSAFAATTDRSFRDRMSLQPGLSRHAPYALRALEFLKLEGLILSAISRWDAVNGIFATRFMLDWQAVKSNLLDSRKPFAAYAGLLDRLVQELRGFGFLPPADPPTEPVVDLRSQYLIDLDALTDTQIIDRFGASRSEVEAWLETRERGSAASFLIRSLLNRQDELVGRRLADVPNQAVEDTDLSESPQEQEIHRATRLLELLDQFFVELHPVIDPFCIGLGVPGLANAIAVLLIPAQVPRTKPGNSFKEEPLRWFLHIQAALCALLREHSSLLNLALMSEQRQVVVTMTVIITGSEEAKGAIRACRERLFDSALLQADLLRLSPSRRATERTVCGQLLWSAYDVEAALTTLGAILTAQLVFGEWLVRQSLIMPKDESEDVQTRLGEAWVPGWMSSVAGNLHLLADRLHSELPRPPMPLFFVPELADSQLRGIYTEKVAQEGLAFAAIYNQIRLVRQIAVQLIRLLSQGLADSLQAEASAKFDQFIKATEEHIQVVTAIVTAINLELAHILYEQDRKDLAGVIDRLLPV
jgi:hypothetical protein